MDDKEINTENVNIDEVSIDADNTASRVPPRAASTASECAAADDATTDDPDDVAISESVEPDAVLELTHELVELKDRYLRLAAELENTRRRAAIDCESAARNRAMSVAGKILPVMDAVDAALRHAPDDAGILALSRALRDAFTQIGIVRMDAVGQPLNPQFHNAIQAIPAPADADPCPTTNTILEEMQPGYMFGETVLRPAMVVVCK